LLRFEAKSEREKKGRWSGEGLSLPLRQKTDSRW
jgi:hypothetical protein